MNINARTKAITLCLSVLLTGTTEASIRPSEPPPLLFKEVTHLSGINHTHMQLSHEVDDIKDSFGAGACLADYNNDGWTDIVFMAGGGNTRLYGKQSWWQKHSSIAVYQNNQSYFKKIPDNQINIPENISRNTFSCRAADFDNDGLTDLLILTDKEDYVLRNKGDFLFELTGNIHTDIEPGWSSHAELSDINNDGLLDIYITRYLDYSKNINRFEKSSGYSGQTKSNHNPELFDGLKNRLLVNQGDMTFRDSTTEFNLGKYNDRSVSALFSKTEKGTTTLTVFNDTKEPTRHYLLSSNQFLEHSDQQDILLTGARFAAPLESNSGEIPKLLFAARGKGLPNAFIPANKNHIAGRLGVDDSFSYNLSRWGVISSDLNYDRSPDLIITTGDIQPDTYGHSLTSGQPNICYTKKIESGTYFRTYCLGKRKSSSRGLYQLDFNNDGLIDILITNNNDYPQLFENISHAPNNWIGFDFSNEPISIELVDKNSSEEINSDHKNSLFGNHENRVYRPLSHSEISVKTTHVERQLSQPQKLQSNSIYRFDGEQWRALPSKLEMNKSQKLIEELLNVAEPEDFIRLTFRRPLHPKTSQQLIKKIFESESNSISSISESLKEHKSTDWLPIYLALSEHSDSQLLLAIIDILETIEDERSYYYLDELLSSEDDQVSCRTAQLFKTWFEEEEAVIRRKWLAIPSIMRIIESSENRSTKQINCLIDALSESDNLTAAAFLSNRLENSNDSTAVIIEALGLLRFKNTVPAIRTKLSSSNLPDVIAQSLIALSRLDSLDESYWLNSACLTSASCRTWYTALTIIRQSNEASIIGMTKLEAWQKTLEEKIILTDKKPPPAVKEKLLDLLAKDCKRNHYFLQHSEQLNNDPLLIQGCSLFTNYLNGSPSELRQQVDLTVNKLFSSTEDSRQLDIIIEFLAKVIRSKPEYMRDSIRMTAAIMNSQQIGDDSKNLWATLTHRFDSFSAGWLKRQIPDDQLLMEQLLDSGHLDLVAEKVSIKDIIEQDHYSIPMKIKVISHICKDEGINAIECVSDRGVL